MGEERNIHTHTHTHTHTHVYIKQIYTDKNRLIGVLSSHTKPKGRAVLPWALSFPCGLDSKESACNMGDPGLIPRSGKSLEKDMATHSSVLAWKIPWMEEPGGPHTIGAANSQTRQSDCNFTFSLY